MNPYTPDQPGDPTTDGVVERIPLLDLELADRYIIENLNNTINKSQEFWNDSNGYNLKTKREKNKMMLDGDHLKNITLYNHQTPFIDNELFVGTDTIVSYIAARSPQAETYPAGDDPESLVLSSHLEKYLTAHSEKFYLGEKIEDSAWDGIENYIGMLKLEWDPTFGKDGEVIPKVIDPKHIIIDHLAKKGEEPRFICEIKNGTVEDLCAAFPDKEDKILDLMGIQRKGTQNMTANVSWREVWFSYYDDDYECQEAVAWYIQNLVLDKKKNINWRYDGDNFMEAPTKPYIPIHLGKGDKWIDRNNALQQAIPQQEILNKLGRQVIDNLATANGTRVIDNSAMSKDDAENWTGDPNQSLLLKIPAGKNLRDVIDQLPPQIVSAELIGEVKGCIDRIHGILGTPSQFRGDDSDQTKTASEGIMIKNQASGRQDKLVRAIDRAMDRYYQLLAQMIVVWYTKKHVLTVDSGDGNFDFVEMHREKVEGMVKVRTGTSLPFDKSREEAVAQNAAELGFLAPYDYYRLMHMENPQKLYDNWAKWKTKPMDLAQDVDNGTSDDEAIMDFRALMGGEKIKQRDDISPEYLEQMRKLMISDGYLRAKRSLQNAVIRFVGKAADNLALRTELDQMSNQQPPKQEEMPAQIMQTGLMPTQPPMPMGGSPMSPTLPGQPMPGPMPMPGGQPGAPMMPPPAPGGMPPMPGAMPPAPMPAGSPVQAAMQAGAPSLGGQPTVNAGNPGQLPPF